MRKIKFRAWDIKDNKMICDVERAYDTLNWYNSKANLDCFGEALEKKIDYEDHNSRNAYIPMQLVETENNDIEFYEGDIVKENNSNKCAIIQYDKHNNGFFPFSLCSDGGWECANFIDPKYATIVGNIFDNTENSKQIICDNCKQIYFIPNNTEFYSMNDLLNSSFNCFACNNEILFK